MRRLLAAIKGNPLFIFPILYWYIRILLLKLQKKKTVLFNFHHAYFMDILGPLCERLKADGRIEIFFSVRRESRRIHPLLKNEKPNIMDNSVSPFILFDMFISPEVTGPDFPLRGMKTLKLQTYHGTGVYNLYEKQDVLKNFDIHFAVGPQYHTFFNESGIGNNAKYRIYDVGYPKTDILFGNGRESKPIQEKYKLSGRPVILYAPHWSEYSSIRRFGDELMENLARYNADIIVKPHNYLYTACPEWEEKLKALAEKIPSLILPEESDTQKFYSVCDVMISDTGTTAPLEYSILGKPLVIFYSREWFEKCESIQPEKDICETAFKAENLEYIKKWLERYFEGKLEKELREQKIKQKKLLENYLYNHGKATGKAYEAILKELGI